MKDKKETKWTEEITYQRKEWTDEIVIERMDLWQGW